MKLSKVLITACLTQFCLLPQLVLAQEDIPSPTGTPDGENRGSVNLGSEENEDAGQPVRIRRNIISGTGIIFTVPTLDVGYLATTPKANNIFSKLETPSTGYLFEPKLGVGVFSQKIALDLLVGGQISSLTGKRTGKIKDSNNESPDAPFDALNPEQPYTLQKTSGLVEGSARIRFQSGTLQAGLTATTVFSDGPRLYSSVAEIGLPYNAFVGPQFIFEQRIKENIFRVGSSVQFTVTGNQRSAFNFKVGASYSFLLNSPFLTQTEKRVVKNKTTVQKQIITTREQNIIENENVSFIFDSQTINFKFNKSELSERSRAFVSGLGQIFSAQRSDWQKLTVEGHTDSKGNPEYNKRLSQQRADAVKQVLVENGLTSDDIETIGYGKERLRVNPERTEVDFARNRRVEIKVQGLKDARFLQRSISRLESQIFPSKKLNEENKGDSQ
jgi:outer membrane protein OmpA-like peptidoglycan-associated protein